MNILLFLFFTFAFFSPARGNVNGTRRDFSYGEDYSLYQDKEKEEGTASIDSLPLCFYNSLGQLDYVYNPDGTEIRYEYDHSGNLSHCYHSDQSFDYLFTYNEHNQLIEVEDLIHNRKTEQVINIFGYDPSFLPTLQKNEEFNQNSYWQNLTSFATNLYTKSSAAYAKAEYFIQKHLSYSNYIKNHLEANIQPILGKSMLVMLGFYQDEAIVGVYGIGELNDKVRITMVNGIMNIRRDCMEVAGMVSKSHGDENVHFIFRPTDGWGWDIFKCCMAKFGYISPHAHQIAATWKEMIKELGGTESEGIIFHYAHSLGGTDSMMAKNLMTPEELKMIHMVTIGSASLISEGDFKSVINYVSRGDGVCPIADPLKYFSGLTDKNHENNVVFVGSFWFWGLPFTDHAITSPTYQNILDCLGKDFVEKYLNKS